MTGTKSKFKGKIEIPVDLEIEMNPEESKENKIIINTKLKSMKLGDPIFKLDNKKETIETSETYTFVPDFENTKIIIGSTVYLTEEDFKNISYTRS